jgi:hypothetical protein
VRASRDQHRHRLGLAETGEVLEVAVLAIGIFDVVIAVPYRRGGQHRDRVAPHQTHQLAAAARKLVSRHGS